MRTNKNGLEILDTPEQLRRRRQAKLDVAHMRSAESQRIFQMRVAGNKRKQQKGKS